MVLHCSELLYYNVSSNFLRQDSQSSYSFGNIQNVGKTELSEQKNLVFHWRKNSYFVFIYIFPLFLVLISSFHTYVCIYIYIYIYTAILKEILLKLEFSPKMYAIMPHIFCQGVHPRAGIPLDIISVMGDCNSDAVYSYLRMPVF